MAKPTFVPAQPGDDGVFHEGELRVQEATGQRPVAERHARLVCGAVPPAPAAFLAQQRMLVLATVDEAGSPWASLVFGAKGFARTSGGVVTIDRSRACVSPGDALLENLGAGGMLGILAIDLGSRWRYRINGFVSSATEERVELGVREAYVNCPKYIQRRVLCDTDGAPRASAASARGDSLDPERQALVRRADTMFVASCHPTRGADASHRGGEPGFLEIRDERTIRVPEYAGNGLYNTLGNLVVSNRAGLAVVDFDGGCVLQLSGSVTVALDPAPAPGAGAATGRYWDFMVSRWIQLPLPQSIRWELVERSPFNPPLQT
ncbi:MAG TPA: pyridoxamine 5'-phosphate oxidase family protein [Planctomycetota bacterium]|nr:pyridoxamine 5'-phosphate oxidase family protein [Planctomycetota bacterium]